MFVIRQIVIERTDEIYNKVVEVLENLTPTGYDVNDKGELIGEIYALEDLKEKDEELYNEIVRAAGVESGELYVQA